MLTAGIDIGSRSAQCVILSDEKILSYSNIETGPDSTETANLAAAEAAKKPGLSLKDLDYVVATGYGRIIVPFANDNVSEITCHAVGASWLMPSVRTILDMGGQDCKVISCDGEGRVKDFVMNDKCAAGTGRFFEVIAGVMELPLQEIGRMSLSANKSISFSPRCVVFSKSFTMSLLRKGESKENILAGLHDAITRRVKVLLQKVGITPDLAVTGGIGKNIGVIKRLEEELNLKIHLPEEPQIAGALGAAVIAKKRYLD